MQQTIFAHLPYLTTRNRTSERESKDGTWETHLTVKNHQNTTKQRVKLSSINSLDKWSKMRWIFLANGEFRGKSSICFKVENIPLRSWSISISYVCFLECNKHLLCVSPSQSFYFYKIRSFYVLLFWNSSQKTILSLDSSCGSGWL